MAVSFNFKEWIESIEHEDYTDVYCLYKSVEDIDEWGSFKCTMKNTFKGPMYFVKCSYIDELLLLGSDKARTYFLEFIEKKFAGDSTMEIWYSLKYNWDKND